MGKPNLTSLVLSNISVTLLTAIIALPFLPVIEAKLFPVVGTLSFEEVVEGDDFLDVYVHFEKFRACEFIGLTFVQGNGRLLVEFPDRDDSLPPSRPVGEWITGPWRVYTNTLDGVSIVVEHRCHSMWNVFTEIYP